MEKYMKIKNKKIVMIIVFIFALFVNSSAVYAGNDSIYFSTNNTTVHLGDTFIVTANVSSTEDINAVAGAISFDDKILELKNISTGNSVMPIFAEDPEYIGGGIIRFVSGNTNAFRGDGGVIIKVAFTAIKTGKSNIFYTGDTKVFLADGKGTEDRIIKKGITISVDKASSTSRDEWQAEIKSDTTPPENIKIESGNSTDIFDGKYFISFYSIDVGSGIDYYQVREGEGGEFITEKSPYVLKNQLNKETIWIRAVDKAGNDTTDSFVFDPTSSQVINAENTNYIYNFIYKNKYILTTIIIFIIALINVIYFARKKKE